MKKLLLLTVIIIVAVCTYLYLNAPSAQAPSISSSSQQVQTSTSASTSNSTTLPPNVGATEDSNPNAPAGTAAECAKCNEYQGAQKAECLVALNCQ